MGFTIDMVSGNISDITNGIDSAKADASPTKPSVDDLDSFLQEQLLPVSDTYIKPEYTIPDSLINREIDSFIEDVTR